MTTAALLRSRIAAAVQIAEFKAKRDAASAKLAKAKAEANGQLQKRIENIESVLGIR